MKVVMSIGNPLKSDDNIGNVILEKIDNKDIIKIKAGITPENFIEQIKKYDEIIILDAFEFKGKVGDVKVFKLDQIKDNPISTHNIPINLFQKFLSGSKIRIIGIKPNNIEFGEKLSRELENKIEEITENVKRLLQTHF